VLLGNTFILQCVKEAATQQLEDAHSKALQDHCNPQLPASAWPVAEEYLYPWMQPNQIWTPCDVIMNIHHVAAAAAAAADHAVLPHSPAGAAQLCDEHPSPQQQQQQ